MSVRFLGRRVYVGLALVLGSGRHAGQNPAAARLATMLSVSRRTVQRWRQWWGQEFALTSLWQAMCARFMPPVATDAMPLSLLERFMGNRQEALIRLLVFLSPLTVTAAVTIGQGR